MIIIRILFGMGEGPLSATINKMVNNWFPANKRASVIGLTNSGTPLGGAIAGPIVGFIAISYGWRVSFIAIMIIGLIWAICWWKFAKEKPNDSIAQENPGNQYVAATTEGNLKFTFYLKQKPFYLQHSRFFV